MNAARYLPIDERSQRSLVDFAGWGKRRDQRGATPGEPLRVHTLNVCSPRRVERVRLSAPLLDEDDVGRADSLDEQLRGPADFRNQRVRLDQKLVDVVGVCWSALIFVEKDAVPLHAVSADVRLRRVRFPFDRLVERELVVLVAREIETRRNLPRLFEGGSLGRIDVRTRQAARNCVRAGAAARTKG